MFRHDNLKPSERSALHSLQKREDIIIKPADKGSAVVVMDREHYVSEAELNQSFNICTCKAHESRNYKKSWKCIKIDTNY